MFLDLSIVEGKHFHKEYLWQYLFEQYLKDNDSLIDITPEAVCLSTSGVYTVIHNFCQLTGYDARRITIKTGNMIEGHNKCKIILDGASWYEVNDIRTYQRTHTHTPTQNPSKTFGCFVSRNHWTRLWIATYLDTYHSDRTIMTYHYNTEENNFDLDDYVGIDDLLRHDCPMSMIAQDFLLRCPKTLDTVDEYPIQNPKSLNLLKYYNDIFVDIVNETTVSGNSFLVTEKLWRSIMAHRPFIVMAPQNYISNLHKLGFQTFNDYWSEDYDRVELTDRINEIIPVIEEIATWDRNKQSQTLNDMQEILTHNYNQLRMLSYQQIEKTFNEG